MKIQKLHILIAFVIFCTPTLAAHAETATPSATADPLLTQIKQAKDLLGPIKLNYALTPHYKSVIQPRSKTKKQVVQNYTLDAKDLALAIFDPQTGAIKITTGMQQGTSVNFPDKSVDIDVVRFNGVNTRFSVNKPAGGKVLALKYLITPTESGSKSQIEKDIYAGVYVPYSPELATPEVSAYGAKYLDSVITAAVTELQNTPSVSVPGQTVPSAIQPQLVRALLYAEHMDTGEFLANSNTQQLIDKINVLLAGNEGETWKYSVSSAGAAGISQFIPSTYASLVKRHPEANLIPDFVSGMRNHVNGVKATFLLLDDYISEVKSRSGSAFLAAHSFDYGVAAYNGGPVRVARATIAYGPLWSQDHSADLAPLQDKLTRQTAVVNTLKAQLKKTKKKYKRYYGKNKQRSVTYKATSPAPKLRYSEMKLLTTL
jgi:hypothetical protein